MSGPVSLRDELVAMSWTEGDCIDGIDGFMRSDWPHEGWPGLCRAFAASVGGRWGNEWYSRIPYACATMGLEPGEDGEITVFPFGEIRSRNWARRAETEIVPGQAREDAHRLMFLALVLCALRGEVTD